jgi:hypothetical protein
MSMYLPNDDVEPTGEEAAEFIAEPTPDAPPAPRAGGDDDQGRDGRSGDGGPRADRDRDVPPGIESDGSAGA